MRPVADRTGQVFGKLTIIGGFEKKFLKNGKTRHYWLTRCECGTLKKLDISGLISGAVVSCGCYNREATRKRCTKHGHYKERIYHIWQGMICRVRETSNSESYKRNYWGRGITVCERWKDYRLFYEDMKQGYADNLTLDRIDNDKGYCKENCRWATTAEQSLNKRSNVSVTISGVTKTVTEFAKEAGLSFNTLQYRIKAGFPEFRLLLPCHKDSKGHTPKGYT